jgi:hypothetical protein
LCNHLEQARTQKGSYLSTMPHAWLIKRLYGFINNKKIEIEIERLSKRRGKSFGW